MDTFPLRLSGEPACQMRERGRRRTLRVVYWAGIASAVLLLMMLTMRQEGDIVYPCIAVMIALVACALDAGTWGMDRGEVAGLETQVAEALRAHGYANATVASTTWVASPRMLFTYTRPGASMHAAIAQVNRTGTSITVQPVTRA